MEKTSETKSRTCFGIRRKIKDHGVYQELIFTIRGEGYVLYD